MFIRGSSFFILVFVLVFSFAFLRALRELRGSSFQFLAFSFLSMSTKTLNNSRILSIPT